MTVGVVLFDDRGRVLCQLRDDIPTIADPNCWTIPGGAIEPDEDPLDAARREFEEETTLSLRRLEVVVDRLLDRGGGLLERQICYWSPEGEGTSPVCMEGQEVRFLEPDTLAMLKTSPRLLEIIRAAQAARARGLIA